MVLLNNWPKNLAVFVMVMALVDTRRHCARMVAVLGLGSTLVAIAALSIGSYRFSGRLILPRSSLGDPNELGMTMLLGVPLLASIIADRSRYLTTRLAAAMCVIPIFAALPLTGSRGTLVAGSIVAVYLFKRFSIGGKLGLVTTVTFFIIITVPFLSNRLLDRFGTITRSEEIERTASTDSRTYLFEQGLILIATNPLFGVGAAMFPVAENDLAIEQGRARGAWHTCHNMFIQVASEGGLPAIAIFLWIIVIAWKTLSSLETLKTHVYPMARETVRLAFWIKITLLTFCACGLFLSIAMSNTFLILIALSLALGRIVSLELNRLETNREHTNNNDQSDTEMILTPLHRSPTA
jgi:O-antigen ligase